MRYNKSTKGFTLVEILVSAMILIVAVAAFFALFIYTAKLRMSSVNELRMSMNASSWLEKVRTGATGGTEYNNLSAQTNIDFNSASSILQEAYTDWIIENEGNIDITNPGDNSKGAFYSTEQNVDLGSGVNFKKITATVLWDEEE